MWSNTTQIGCARAYSISEAYKVYDVCRFYPQGNMSVSLPLASVSCRRPMTLPLWDANTVRRIGEKPF